MLDLNKSLVDNLTINEVRVGVDHGDGGASPKNQRSGWAGDGSVRQTWGAHPECFLGLGAIGRTLPASHPLTIPLVFPRPATPLFFGNLFPDP